MPDPAARVRVILPRGLAAIFPGIGRETAATGGTVLEVINDVDSRVPGFANRVLDAGPSVREHLNIFVNGDRADVSTPVPDGATVHVIPAISGG